MTLIVQPINPRGLLCFSGSRTFEAKDANVALSVPGVCTAVIRTEGRTEDRYCLELKLDSPLVEPDGIAELLELINRLCDALGLFVARYVLGPERRGAGREAETFADWLILRKN